MPFCVWEPKAQRFSRFNEMMAWIEYALLFSLKQIPSEFAAPKIAMQDRGDPLWATGKSTYVAPTA